MLSLVDAIAITDPATGVFHVSRWQHDPVTRPLPDPGPMTDDAHPYDDPCALCGHHADDGGAHIALWTTECTPTDFAVHFHPATWGLHLHNTHGMARPPAGWIVQTWTLMDPQDGQLPTWMTLVAWSVASSVNAVQGAHATLRPSGCPSPVLPYPNDVDGAHGHPGPGADGVTTITTTHHGPPVTTW